MSEQQTTKAIVNSLQSHSFVATSCFWGAVACFSTMTGYGTAGGIFFGIATLVFTAASSARADDLQDGARVVTKEVNKLRNDVRHLKMDIDHLIYQKAVLEIVVAAAGEVDGDAGGNRSPSTSIMAVPHRGKVH